MSSKRVFLIMSGLVVLLIGLTLAVVLVGNGLLQKQADRLLGAKLENRLLEEQQTALIQANKDVEKYAELEEIAKDVVPQDKDQARAVREIVKIAQEAGVPLQAISFPSSSLGQTTPKGPTPAPSDGESAAPAAPAPPPVTQAKPVEGISGVYAMEIAIQSSQNAPVPYSRLLDFLTRLEQNRRTAHVATINIQPDAQKPSLLSFNLTVNAYIKP